MATDNEQILFHSLADEVRVKAITAMKEHDPSLEDSHTGVVHLDLSKAQPSTVELLQAFVSKFAIDCV